jgi:hypothetical protein
MVMMRQGALSALYLAAVGGLAVGASGALIAIMGWIAGATFIVDTSRLATALTSTDCVRLLKNDAHAASCYQAALTDWAHDTVVNRLALGLLALLALLVFIRLRRRWPRDATRLLTARSS